jgi:hypothetical protein
MELPPREVRIVHGSSPPPQPTTGNATAETPFSPAPGAMSPPDPGPARAHDDLPLHLRVLLALLESRGEPDRDRAFGLASEVYELERVMSASVGSPPAEARAIGPLSSSRRE